MQRIKVKRHLKEHWNLAGVICSKIHIHVHERLQLVKHKTKQYVKDNNMDPDYVDVAWSYICKILRMMRVTGVYISFTDTKRPTKIFNLLLAVLFQGFLWIEAIRYSIRMFSSSDVTVFCKIMILAIKLQSALIPTLISLNFRHLHNFPVVWRQQIIQRPKWFQWKLVRLCRIMYLVLIPVICTFSVIFVGIGLWQSAKNSEELLDMTMLNWSDNATEVQSQILFGVHMLVPTTSILGAVISFFFYLSFVNIFRREFDFIRKTFTNHYMRKNIKSENALLKNVSSLTHETGSAQTDKSTQDVESATSESLVGNGLGSEITLLGLPKTWKPEIIKEDVRSNLEDIRLEHDQLCQMLEVMNKACGPLIAVCLLSSVIITCLSIYNTMDNINSNGIPVRTALGFVQFCMCLGLIVFILVDGILINDSAHSLLPLLHRVDTRNLKEAEKLQLQMFMLRLTGPPIGISAMGIFIINRESVLTIAGAIITYAVIVYELSPPSNPPVIGNEEHTLDAIFGTTPSNLNKSWNLGF